MANYIDQDYEIAQQRLQQRRDAAKDRAEQNKLVAYTRFPRLQEIENEMKMLTASLGRMISIGNAEERTAALEDLRVKGDVLTLEREKILADNNMSKDYFQDQYTCTVCKDTGSLPDGGFCECYKQLLKQVRFDRINSSSNIKLSDFSTFDLSYYSQEIGEDGVSDYRIMEGNLNYCKNYAKNFDPACSKNLLMIGGTGLGKTHLSLAIAKEVINLGYQVIYGSTQNLMSIIEKENFSREKSTATLESLLSSDLLILDDLGTEFTTSFTTSTMYNLINSRINAGLPTIINTNLSYKELEEEYSPRICSRIMGAYQEIAFFGQDIRIQKNNREQGL